MGSIKVFIIAGQRTSPWAFVKNEVIKKLGLHVCIDLEGCLGRKWQTYERSFVLDWYNPLAIWVKIVGSTELCISTLSGWPKALWSGLVGTHNNFSGQSEEVVFCLAS